MDDEQKINLENVSWIKKRKIEPLNILIRLQRRSINYYGKCQKDRNRKLYQNFTPNFTAYNVKKPACYIRKFTPCGRSVFSVFFCMTKEASM